MKITYRAGEQQTCACVGTKPLQREISKNQINRLKMPLGRTILHGLHS